MNRASKWALQANGGHTSEARLVARINRVCEHIAHHLDDALTLDELGSVAALSKHHFLRLFVAVTGITPHRYARLQRLRRASMQLAFESDMRVLDIAVAAGFSSHEAFARRFKRTFDQTPSEFRNRPDWIRWHQSFEYSLPEKEINMHAEVIEMPDVMVAMLSHRGAPERVLETVAQFIEWRKASGRSPVAVRRTFGIGHSDPAHTPAADFRFDVCGEILRPIEANDHGVRNGRIEGGRWARYRHHGPRDARFEQCIRTLYAQWLPHSGECLRDAPLLFEYHDVARRSDECDFITDVLLPLQ